MHSHRHFRDEPPVRSSKAMRNMAPRLVLPDFRVISTTAPPWRRASACRAWASANSRSGHGPPGGAQDHHVLQDPSTTVEGAKSVDGTRTTRSRISVLLQAQGQPGPNQRPPVVHHGQSSVRLSRTNTPEASPPRSGPPCPRPSWRGTPRSSPPGSPPGTSSSTLMDRVSRFGP